MKLNKHKCRSSAWLVAVLFYEILISFPVEIKLFLFICRKKQKYCIKMIRHTILIAIINPRWQLLYRIFNFWAAFVPLTKFVTTLKVWHCILKLSTRCHRIILMYENWLKSLYSIFWSLIQFLQFSVVFSNMPLSLNIIFSSFSRTAKLDNFKRRYWKLENWKWFRKARSLKEDIFWIYAFNRRKCIESSAAVGITSEEQLAFDRCKEIFILKIIHEEFSLRKKSEFFFCNASQLQFLSKRIHPVQTLYM